MKEKIIENEKWLNNKIIAYRNRRTLIYSLNPWCVPRPQAPTKNTKLNEFSTRTEQVLQFTLLLTCMKPRHLKAVVQAKMVKTINFLFFAQNVSSGSGALRPKFFGG